MWGVHLNASSHGQLVLKIILQECVFCDDLLQSAVHGSNLLSASFLELLDVAVVVCLGGSLVVQLLPHGSEFVSEGFPSTSPPPNNERYQRAPASIFEPRLVFLF